MAEDSLSWTRPHTLFFIELLKQYPCIWKVKSKNYRNKHMRNVALNAICVEMSAKVNCNVTSDDIMKKLHTLRTQFRREVKAVEDSHKAGSGSDEVYRPKLWCFDELGFFDDGDILQESAATLDELESCIQVKGDQNFYESPMNAASSLVTPCLPISHKKRKRDVDFHRERLLEKAEKYLDEEEDEYDSFGKYVAGKLRRLSETQRIFAEKQIMGILYNGVMNTISARSSISSVNEINTG